MFFKIVKCTLVAAVLIQFLPYGHSHTNPPVIQEPAWNSPATKALFRRACFDCHSNETTWPWYSHVAPVSWLVQNDVDGGRKHLNFSEWIRDQRHAKDVSMEVKPGDMPPWFYFRLAKIALVVGTAGECSLVGIESEGVRSGSD